MLRDGDFSGIGSDQGLGVLRDRSAQGQGSVEDQRNRGSEES